MPDHVPSSKDAPDEKQQSYRVLIVDDHAELRVLLRTRLEFESDIEVVGEASNGAEAVRLTRALAPSAVILDLEMPVMRGDEAIPLMRETAPGMGILLYTGGDWLTLPEEARPDVMVQKGVPLTEVVTQLRSLFERAPFDVMRLELGALPLRQAITAFDTWTGLNVRVLEALERGDELVGDQMSGRSRTELEALMGVFALIGYGLQKAARAGSDEVSPVLHIFRSTGVMARQALLSLNDPSGFWKAWGYDVPVDAVEALNLMRDRLIKVLPASTGKEATPASPRSGNQDDDPHSRDPVASGDDVRAEVRDLEADLRDAVSEKLDAGVLEDHDPEALGDVVAHAAADRADAAVDRVAAAADRVGAAVRDREADVRDSVSEEHDAGLLRDHHTDALEDMVAHAAADRADAAVDRVAAAADREGAAVRDQEADVRDVVSKDHDAGALKDHDAGAFQDIVAHAAAD